MVSGYKDIINFSIIRKLKAKMNDACIIFNNLVKKEFVEKRESQFYEVYNAQYMQDIANLAELRDRCLSIADNCNAIMLRMNNYHIKQYYLDPNELTEYENIVEEYKAQLPEEPSEEPTNAPIVEDNKIFDDEDIW